MDWKLKLRVLWDSFLDFWDGWKYELGLILGAFEVVIGVYYNAPFSFLAGAVLMFLTANTVWEKRDM
jgi:hypothetical protein